MNKYRRLAAICHAAAFARVLTVLLAVWLSVRAVAAAEIKRPADAIEVFHCDFDESWDANFDHWPDRWTRKSGAGFPHYVDIRVRDADDPDATSGRYLKINLDGASAEVSSPPIRVMSRFSYLLVTRLYVSGLQHSEVTVSIDFLNAEGALLQSQRQLLASRSDGWHTITLESIDPQNASIDRAVVTLNIRRVGRGDLQGTVCLDDVWLARLPRITVSTNNACNVYREKDDVTIHCELSGIREKNPEIRFQLFDASSNQLEDGSVQLEGRLIEEDTKTASDIVDGIGNSPKGYEGYTEWQPNIPGPGFYSVVVTMLSSDHSGQQTDAERKMDRRRISLAVVPPLSMPATGDFGWTLPEFDDALSLQEMARLLPNAGVNWVKLPAWYDYADTHRGDEIIRFVEMLGASNVEVVGVIDRPPANSDIAQRLDSNATIADLIAFDQAVWLPALDPVISRLSMRLRYWQVGNDQDTSLVGFPSLAKRIGDLRQRLFRFGQQVNLGLPWTWDVANPPPADASWDFEQLIADPALSIGQFEKLVSQPRRRSLKRWVTIEPPPRFETPAQGGIDHLNARATGFVRKLVVAKEHGADAIFISRPFDERNGLMRADGMPAELLLPWRTTASMLSGTKYLGSVNLPNGSENRNFVRPDGRVVMVVWNAEPTTEVLFLGSNAQQIDIWGVSRELPLVGRQQEVEVGPTPTFVIGVSEPIVRWRMAARFEHDHVESIFAKPHPNAVHFQNFFTTGVGGTIAITVPQVSGQQSGGEDSSDDDSGVHNVARASDRWSIEPPEGSFSLSAGEAASFPFDVKLKNAIFGVQPVRVDFVVDADEVYHFSVYRTMCVGTGDVTIDFKSHLDQDGTLIVEQFMTNNSEQPVDFKCSLYAKGYRRQRAQVYRLGPKAGRTVYRYSDGAALVGKELMLEAEEIGGERVLKYRFLVTDEPPIDKAVSPPTRPESNNNQALRGVEVEMQRPGGV